jgi:hypothetical protein
MDMVKKNIVSILCGVVALLAIIAIFWPISGMAASLQAKVTQSKTNYYDKIQALRTAKRRLPITNPLDPNAEQPPLNQFPTEEVIKQGEAARDAVARMSQQMEQLAVEKNRHVPLLPMSVTNPPDAYAFKNAYLQALGMVPPTANNTEVASIKSTLQSVTPPNQDEINAEAAHIFDAEFRTRIIIINGQPSNKPQVEQQFNQMKEKLPEKMRRERAEKYKIYLEPDALEYSHALGVSETKPATPEQMWYAQNMLWIDQDVCDAIARINQSAKNILDAPVKQLAKISLPEDDKQYITLQSSGAPTTGDTAVTLTDDFIAGKAYNLSETGRISNPVYDVIHFMVDMNVDARKVPRIIAELQRGKLITVYTAETRVIDAAAAVDDGYVYGDAPMVNLRLSCEELFLRGWTVGKDPAKDALMPVGVEQVLGIGAQ